MYKPKKPKSYHKKDCVSNEEAEDIKRKPKFGTPGEWVQQGENPFWHCISFALADKTRVTIPGLFVEISHLTGKKVKFEKNKATLFLREPGQPLRRVVQIDVKKPLPKGGERAEDWPHEHFGQSRIPFTKELAQSLINLNVTVKYFLDRSNIQLDESIDVDFKKLEYELK